MATQRDPSSACCRLSVLAKQPLPGQHGDSVTNVATNLAQLNLFPGIDAQTWEQIRSFREQE